MTEHADQGDAQDIKAIKMDLAAMRSQSLRGLWVGIFALGVLWVVYAIFGTPGAPFYTLIPPAGLLAIATSTFGLNQQWPVWTRRLFVFQLAALLMLYLIVSPSTLGVFFSLPVIVVASLLLERRWMLALSLALLASMTILMFGDIAMLGNLYSTVLAIDLVTIGVLWVSTDNLYTALAWAMYSQQEAQQHLDNARRRQAELGRLTAILGQNQERLHYLNLRLEQARVTAEEAYRTKQHFVANVSHELRTPLNLITGFSEMMAFSPESYGGVPLPSSYREDIMEIYRSSKHLLALVEDVLALAQLEAGKMLVKRTWSDLDAVIDEAAETMRPLIEAKGLVLSVEHVDTMPSTFMDPGRIRQVLLNLLNNAYRFTETGSIRIKSQTNVDQAIVSVIDTGVGISPAELPRIFSEFHSLGGGPTARRDGFGLGLSISRRLAEAHGGELMAESAIGHGSTFSLHLPLGGATEVDSRPSLVRTAPGPSAEASRPVILEMGPDHGAEAALGRYLEGYRVVHTEPWEIHSFYERYLPIAIWINDSSSNGGIPKGLTQSLQGIPSVPVFVCRVPTLNDAARRLQVDHILNKPVTLEKLDHAMNVVDGQGPCRVLVVDDDPRMVRLVSRTLHTLTGGLSHDIIEACGGNEGRTMFDQEHPDIVFLDLAMPGVSGYDVLNHIHEAHVDTHVVLMTGLSLSEDDTPVYNVSVHSNEGFALVRSIQAVQAMIETLSGRPTQV